jgi:hypothetical protein
VIFTQQGIFWSSASFEQQGTFGSVDQRFTFEQTGTFGETFNFTLDGDFNDRVPGGSVTLKRIVRASVNGGDYIALKVVSP